MINKRRFKRNKMKGIMTSTQCLKHLLEKGPLPAVQPHHPTINSLVDKGWVTRKGSILTLTIAGRAVAMDRHPDTIPFGEEEEA